MKSNNTSLACLFFVAMLLVSCKDENTGLQTQEHNANALMTMMHDMMDDMHAMTPTNDPDFDFANMMKRHHQGALSMAEYETANGDDSEIKAMAEKMKMDQQEEIAKLDSFISVHNAHTTSQEYTDKVKTSMEKMEKAKDLQIITGDADYDFASLIIPHHQSAIEISRALLDHGHHQELKDMASMMIEMQEKEIVDLQNWLITQKEY